MSLASRRSCFVGGLARLMVDQDQLKYTSLESKRIPIKGQYLEGKSAE